MRKLVFLILVIGIYACEEKKPEFEMIEAENFTQYQINTILADFKFEYDSPVFIDSTDIVLLPVTTKLLDRRKTFSSEGYYSNDYSRYWNILFYNKKTGETKLLTESKLRINNYVVNIKKCGPILAESILYEIGDTDFNNDEKLNDKDPQQLFISKVDGSGFSKISPIDEDLISYTIIPNSDQIIVETRRDINGDLAFKKEDELIWYKIDLSTNSEPIEIIDSSKRKKIEHLYFEQWLKKK